MRKAETVIGYGVGKSKIFSHKRTIFFSNGCFAFSGWTGKICDEVRPILGFGLLPSLSKIYGGKN